EPASEAEADLVSAISGTTQVLVELASAHDDESPGSAESYAIPFDRPVRSLSAVHASHLIVPSGAAERCSVITTPRFEAWSDASGTPGLTTWSLRTECPLRHPRNFSCDRRCLPELPVFDTDGRAACRVYVESQSNTPCPEAIGWF